MDIKVRPVHPTHFGVVERLALICWLYVSAYIRFHGVELGLLIMVVWLLLGTLDEPQRHVADGQKRTGKA